MKPTLYTHVCEFTHRTKDSDSSLYKGSKLVYRQCSIARLFRIDPGWYSREIFEDQTSDANILSTGDATTLLRRLSNLLANELEAGNIFVPSHSGLEYVLKTYPTIVQFVKRIIVAGNVLRKVCEGTDDKGKAVLVIIGLAMRKVMVLSLSECGTS